MSIELYSWGTPNGRKVSICLEEMELEYNFHPINISKDEQFQPHFLEIAPNNRIPAIVDNDNGMTLMETGAIMHYLAEKTGKFLPASGEARWKTIEWLMWQMGGFGPMLGQAHHFLKFNKGKSEYAEERYATESKRLYGVLDRRLADNEWINGSDYSIADMAAWPWAARHEWHDVDVAGDYKNVARWFRTIAARPAIARGWNVPETDQKIPQI